MTTPSFPPDYGPDPRDEYFADMSINSPQLIKGKRDFDGCVLLAKQDVQIRIPKEDFEMAVELLKWVARTGLLSVEADQARDLLEVLGRECEGR